MRRNLQIAERTRSHNGDEGAVSDLRDFSKLDIRDGRIHYFLYQQDGSKQSMDCADTLDARMFVSWAQVHDAPTGFVSPDLASLI